MITVKNADTGAILKEGYLIESGTKVTVFITPNARYYLTGKDVADDYYKKTMTFAENKKNINSIVSKHPAEKYYRITLDRSDSYAKYTYKLDGKTVSGTINARAGQNLELSYEITDSAYKLSKSHNGTLIGINASDVKATESITVTPEMDGKRIKKTDFDIETVKQL